MKWQAYMYSLSGTLNTSIGYSNWLARMSPACRDGVEQQSLVRNWPSPLLTLPSVRRRRSSSSSSSSSHFAHVPPSVIRQTHGAVHFIDTEKRFRLFTVPSSSSSDYTWRSPPAPNKIDNLIEFLCFFLQGLFAFSPLNIYFILLPPPLEFVAQYKMTNKIFFSFHFREPPVLGRYDNKDVLLKLPLGVKVRDLRWLSVWCRRFAVTITRKYSIYGYDFITLKWTKFVIPAKRFFQKLFWRQSNFQIILRQTK
jgi:hypothetical protein